MFSFGDKATAEKDGKIMRTSVNSSAGFDESKFKRPVSQSAPTPKFADGTYVPAVNVQQRQRVAPGAKTPSNAPLFPGYNGPIPKGSQGASVQVRSNEVHRPTSEIDPRQQRMRPPHQGNANQNNSSPPTSGPKNSHPPYSQSQYDDPRQYSDQRQQYQQHADPQQYQQQQYQQQQYQQQQYQQPISRQQQTDDGEFEEFEDDERNHRPSAPKNRIADTAQIDRNRKFTQPRYPSQSVNREQQNHEQQMQYLQNQQLRLQQGQVPQGQQGPQGQHPQGQHPQGQQSQLEEEELLEYRRQQMLEAQRVRQSRQGQRTTSTTRQTYSPLIDANPEYSSELDDYERPPSESTQPTVHVVQAEKIHQNSCPTAGTSLTLYSNGHLVYGKISTLSGPTELEFTLSDDLAYEGEGHFFVDEIKFLIDFSAKKVRIRTQIPEGMTPGTPLKGSFVLII